MYRNSLLSEFFFHENCLLSSETSMETVVKERKFSDDNQLYEMSTELVKQTSDTLFNP